MTDGRFSGGTSSLCVGHIAAEAGDGGPIALVRNGDHIQLDVAAGTLDVLVADTNMADRRLSWTPSPPPGQRGVLGKYARSVSIASTAAICG